MNILVIRKEDADYWDSLIQSPAVDLDELELPKNELLARWTTTFDDGVEADLKVCSGEDDVWCEMVWFHKDGVELTCSDPCKESLEGEWPCSLEGHDVLVETGVPKERKPSWREAFLDEIMIPVREMRDVMAELESGEGHAESAEALRSIGDGRLLNMFVAVVKSSNHAKDIPDGIYNELRAIARSADEEDRE